MKLVVLVLAAACIACERAEETPAADDVPPDLTWLVECRNRGPGGVETPVIAVERMPPHVAHAFLAAEDRRFYKHPSSSSPIVQLLVKQLPLECLAPPREPVDKARRKQREASLVAQIDRALTRPQILSIYLNHVYLGHGAYGVVAAARVYFGKDLVHLTVGEAAMLAGLVASPAVYAPHNNPRLARERQVYVLDIMRQDGYLTTAEAQTAVEQPIVIVPDKP